VLILVTSICSVTAAFAQQPDEAARTPAGGEEPDEPRFATWLGHARSDNLQRIVDGARGSFTGLGVLLDLERESARIDTIVNTNLELRRYSAEGIEDDPVGDLAAAANFHIVPDRFNWRFEERYGQGQIDPLAAAGPNNRESINVFSTGPEFEVPLGSRTELALLGDYSSRRYGDSASLDSDSTVVELGVFRRKDRTSRYGIAANTNSVEYDLAGVDPYDIRSLSLRYEKTLATGQVSAELGTNSLDFRGEESDEPLLNFEWRRAIATRSTLSIAASRSFSDSAGMFGLTPEQAPVGNEGATLLNSSPLDAERLEVSYSLEGRRTEVTVGLGTADESYVGDAEFDNRSTTTRVSLQRTVSPRLTFGVMIDNVTRDFDQAAFSEKYKDNTLVGWVNKSLSRTLNLGFVLTQYERKGTPSFDEDRYEVRLSYSPSGSAGDTFGLSGR
jgi:hypothetical protein